uniref:Uncharacterized protein n=1 Tax=Anopheles minimus TaxID=112268 RepID=A0A182WPU4_9DIPT
MANQNVVKVGF